MIKILKGTSRWIIIPMIIVLVAILLFSIPGIFSPSPSARERVINAERKSDIAHIIRFQVEDYYDDKNCYPTSLSELEKFIESESTEDNKKKLPKDPKTGEDYLYAHYPAENPTSYHLGVVLEIKDDADLNDDADFNSKTAGYVNGFDGGGQVFDIHVEN